MSETDMKVYRLMVAIIMQTLKKAHVSNLGRKKTLKVLPLMAGPQR